MVTMENGRFVLQDSAELWDPLLERPGVGDFFVADGVEGIWQVNKPLYTYE